MNSFLFDTVLKAIPAEQAKPITPEMDKQIEKQGQIWSLHPQCPEGVRYAGSRSGKFGDAYDYYVDEKGTYWYASRDAAEPVVISFIYEKSWRRGIPARKRRPYA